MKHLLPLLLILSGCKGMESYPDEMVTIIDLKNVQCRKYQLVDKKEVKFQGPVAYENLYMIVDGKTVPNPECEGVIGYMPKAFKNVQNWARDIQKE